MPRSPFDDLMRDIISIVKSDGRIFENVKANVQPKLITIHDETLPLEEDDRIYRSLPNGLIEEYLVLDRGFHQKFYDIPGGYQAKVQRITSSAKEKLMTPETLRTILAVISKLEGEDRNTFVTDAEISQELNISIRDTRDYLDILEREGKIQAANSFDGHSALLTAFGRITLRDPNYQPTVNANNTTNTSITISGNVSGSILNINSTLNDASQVVNAAPGLSSDVKSELMALIEELNQVLQEAPDEVVEDAEAVAESAKDLVAAATKEQPNRSRVRITKEGLEKAATNIASVLPRVLPVAMEIAARVQQILP